MTTDRSRQGAFIWILAIQFFIAQAVVQSAWTTPFSLTTNFISDLGNTTCAPSPPESTSYVCSPGYAVMNASFIFLGIIKILGAILIRAAFPTGPLRDTGLSLIALSGLGVILVGLFPQDVNIDWHRAGAGIDLVCGNLGIAVLGVAMWRSGRRAGFAAYSILSGVAGLVALWLFVAEHNLGLGTGGMERVTAYSNTVWLILAGVILLQGGSTTTSTRSGRIP